MLETKKRKQSSEQSVILSFKLLDSGGKIKRYSRLALPSPIGEGSRLDLLCADAVLSRQKGQRQLQAWGKIASPQMAALASARYHNPQNQIRQQPRQSTRHQ
jgi:hypothetical protein